MKIITRGKGIPEFSMKRGIMRIDFTPNKEEKIWLKLDASNKGQYIIELTKFELAKAIAVGMLDDEVIRICKRILKGYHRDLFISNARRKL